VHVLGQAEKEAERAAAHEVAWQAQYGHKEVHVSDAIEPEHDANKHCYVCKKWGHTKKDCPHKRCRFCGKEGHLADECQEKDKKISSQFDKDKERKRQKSYAAKKAKRREEWEKQLRTKTGIDGFEVLYEILGLPPRKLATKEAIRRAYRLQSLRYHPDKVRPEEAEEAAEKFLAVKTAYDLLLEGMDTGGAGMKGAVFSGGDLEFKGSDAQQVPTMPQATRMDASTDMHMSAVGVSTYSASAPAVPAPSESTEDDAALFAEMESGSAVERLHQMAAMHAAMTEEAAANDSDDEARNVMGREDHDEPGLRWLSDTEVRVLLNGEHGVRMAVNRIAADPRVLDDVLDDAVAMGVLHSVMATRREAVVATIS